MENEQDRPKSEKRRGERVKRVRVRRRVVPEEQPAPRSERLRLPDLSSFPRISSLRDLSFFKNVTRESVFAWAALVTGSASLSIAPWFLGGVVPHARMVLICGSVLAAVFAVMRFICCRELPSRMPPQCVALLGLILIVGYQLLPLWGHPATYMSHATNADLAVELPAVAAAEGRKFPTTTMPAETTQALSQLLSITLLSLVFVETVSTPRRAVGASMPLCLSGMTMSLMALGQRVESTAVLFRNDLKISDSPPFGCFVNPNNAAGWLIVCLSASLFVTGIFLGRTPETDLSRTRSRSRRVQLRSWFISLMKFAGGLNAFQIGAGLLAVLLLAAIAGTLSRGGIVAGLVCISVFFGYGIQIGGRSFSLLAFLIVLFFGGMLLLFLQLDTLVISELQTLKDPISATTIRLLHWWDMLPEVLDFPFFGSGAGAYRYSNLPYANHYTVQWFGHADNQFLEILVEVGLVGFLLTAFAIYCTLRSSARLLTAIELTGYDARRHLADRIIGPVVGLILSLLLQNFFDFSFSIPAVISAALMLAMLQERVLENVDNSGSRSSATSVAGHREGRAGRLRFLPLCVWGILIPATLSSVSPVWRALQVYSTWAEARRVNTSPRIDTRLLGERGDQLLSELNEAVGIYPEGELLRRARVMFLQTLATYSIVQDSLQALPLNKLDLQILDQRERERFALYSIRPMAYRFLSPENADIAGSVRGIVDRSLKKYPWQKAYFQELQQNAFARGLSVDLFAALQFQSSAKLDKQVLASLRFCEPAAAQHLTYAGQVLVLGGRIETGLQFWKESLKYSEEFRSAILHAAAAEFGADAALERFLPSEFEPCATAAVGSPAGSLRDRMLQFSDQLWERGGFELQDKTIVLRSEVLSLLGRHNESLELLRETLGTAPEKTEIRKQLAELLERAGRNEAAYEEWEQIRELDPTFPGTEESLERLLRKPPDDYGRPG